MSEEESSNKTFLKASDPSTWQKDEDETWGDRFLNPNRPLLQRHRELARLAAHGKTNVEIAKQLKYTQSRVCVLLTNTKIKNAIEEYRDKLFAVDADARMKDLVPDAFNAMEDILKDEQIDSKDKEAAARWVIEKVTGRPSQQVDVSGNVSIGHLFDKLDNMDLKDVGSKDTKILKEGESEVIDIEATETVQLDDFNSWLDENL